MQKKIYQKLFGAELIDFDRSGFTVEKNGKQYHFLFDDEGSYSDWWELSSKVFFSKNSKEKPVIVDFKIDNKKDKKCVFTLFGMARKPLAQMSAIFHNDSGWDYGCVVSLYCKEIDQNEIIFD